MANIQKGSDFLVSLLNSTAQVKTAFEQSFKFGNKESAEDAANKVVQGRINMNALNGSGPNDAGAAMKLPQTLNQTLFSSANGKSSVNAQDGKQQPLLIAAAVLGAILIFKNFKL